MHISYLFFGNRFAHEFWSRFLDKRKIKANYHTRFRIQCQNRMIWKITAKSFFVLTFPVLLLVSSKHLWQEELHKRQEL